MDKLTIDICKILTGMGAVNLDNDCMSPVTAIHLKDREICCRGILRSSRKLVPTSILHTSVESSYLNT